MTVLRKIDDCPQEKNIDQKQTAEIEMLTVRYFDHDGRLLGETALDTGSPDSVRLPVRKLVNLALTLDADSIALTHNHPSGDATPSKADIMHTRTLVRLLSPLGIFVRDHVITASNDNFSFRDAGLI
jgi:DNA repair protein RadC